mgnify:CR=1 FL=1
MSYRECAEKDCEITGQTIIAMGVWKRYAGFVGGQEKLRYYLRRRTGLCESEGKRLKKIRLVHWRQIDVGTEHREKIRRHEDAGKTGLYKQIYCETF